MNGNSLAFVSNTPLPYFALSNLLTLFSHDVPTLPLIQHIFDYLLCRPPIISVYLAAAVRIVAIFNYSKFNSLQITLARKDEAQLLEEEGEEGMLHSLLSSLPDLSDESTDSFPNDTPDIEVDLNRSTSFGGDQLQYESNNVNTTSRREPTDVVGSNEDFAEKSASIRHSEVEQGQVEKDSPKIEIPLNDSEEVDGEEAAEHSSPTSPAGSQPRAKRKIVNLPHILKQADELFTRFPPSHPELYLSSILAPQSVVFTWSENQDEVLSDDEAEAIVSQPELVVLPYRDPDEISLYEGRKQGEPAPSQKYPRGRQSRLDSRTMLLTGVVVAGIAVAIYSLKSRGSRGKVEELKKAGQWLAELLDAKVYPF